GLAQQPPRFPDLLPARSASLADRPVGGADPAARDVWSGLGCGAGGPGPSGTFVGRLRSLSLRGGVRSHGSTAQGDRGAPAEPPVYPAVLGWHGPRCDRARISDIRVSLARRVGPRGPGARRAGP